MKKILIVLGCIAIVGGIYYMEHNNLIRMPHAAAKPMAHQNKDVLIFSTPYCRYCTMAKELLDQKGIKYIEMDVMESEGRAEMDKYAPGSKTVPQIVIGTEHIGGYSELKELVDGGKLEKMLACKI